jgi:hypothetical protein
MGARLTAFSWRLRSARARPSCRASKWRTLGAVRQLQLAQAGRVEDQAAAGPDDQLAAGRRVPTLAVVADLLDRLHVPADQAVDQRRLAHTRGAQQGDRAMPAEVALQVDQAQAGHGADDEDRDARRGCRGAGDGSPQIGADVGLVQDDHRLDRSLPGERPVDLEGREREEAQRMARPQQVAARRPEDRARGVVAGVAEADAQRSAESPSSAIFTATVKVKSS